METQTLADKRSESIRRILEAATLVFAEDGFSGARVDAIAERAGVNKAMIYYRIGDKEALYAKVLHNIFSDTVRRVANNIKPDQSPEEKLKNYIRNLTMTIERHPQMPQIMMREFASGGRHFPEVLAGDFARILNILKGILKEGEERGIFIKTNTFITQMMIVGTMAFYQTTTPLRQRFAKLNSEIELEVGQFDRNAAQVIEELILRAIIK